MGIKACIAEGYERIHRSNLVGMGILPLQYVDNQNTESLGLTGKEEFDIELHDNIKIHDLITVKTNSGVEFKVKVRLDTLPEIEYYKHNGILLFVLRNLLKK